MKMKIFPIGPITIMQHIKRFGPLLPAGGYGCWLKYIRMKDNITFTAWRL